MTVPTPTAALYRIASESASAAGSRRRSQQNTTRGTAAPCAQRCTTPETVARTFVLHLQAPARQSMRASVLIMAAMQIDSTTALRCVIVPGNGCTGRVADANWYGWLERELRRESQFREVVLPETMPDPVGAKESVWVPFMREALKVGPDTVVVGHSSGAVAAMRLAEETPVAALVLVSACHTDLGDPGERAAGYYARPWRWDAIRANAGRIVQFHSDNDPFIPDSEARHVAENLQSEYSELPGRSHFFTPPFAECLGVCREIASASTA